MIATPTLAAAAAMPFVNRSAHCTAHAQRSAGCMLRVACCVLRAMSYEL